MWWASFGGSDGYEAAKADWRVGLRPRYTWRNRECDIVDGLPPAGADGI
ncbi:hypothetical protein RAS2_00640 [Phycisphaerae bacterium RAS2]|nr:hypothetical protein RAS2_00640 [Phycisphaerae bacterium RAS2]